MRYTGGVGVAGRAGERAGGMTMMVRNLSHWHMAVPRLELSISPGEGVAIEQRKYANMRKSDWFHHGGVI